MITMTLTLAQIMQIWTCHTNKTTNRQIDEQNVVPKKSKTQSPGLTVLLADQQNNNSSLPLKQQTQLINCEDFSGWCCMNSMTAEPNTRQDNGKLWVFMTYKRVSERGSDRVSEWSLWIRMSTNMTESMAGLCVVRTRLQTQCSTINNCELYHKIESSSIYAAHQHHQHPQPEKHWH